jgi:hypothetical protein|tara:strand:- start:4434 stop:4652 length:219 start_codon:yes stop_codon:yes gene_type:complete
MTVTTNEFGQVNMFANEPAMYIDPEVKKQMQSEIYETHNEKAEKLNGRLAMLGLVSAFLSYAFTGKLFFGVF